MSKRHDENKDLKSVSRIAKLNYGDKTIRVPNKDAVGIHTWGKIDFLVKYCGWHYIYDKSAGVGGYHGYINNTIDYNTMKKNLKKEKKEKKSVKSNIRK